MRLFLLGLLTLATTTAAQAQLAAGTTLLGGRLGYHQRQRQTPAAAPIPAYEEHYRQLTLSPTGGYFVAENLLVGLNLDWQLTTNKYPAFFAVPIDWSSSVPGTTLYQESRQRSLQVGPMVRYYWFMGEKAAFYGQAGGGYTKYQTENQTLDSNGSYDSHASGFYTQLSPGFAYFPIRMLALELGLRGLNYQHTTGQITSVNYSGSTSTSQFDIGVRLRDLRLGAAFYLGRH